ncbi:MAG: hypothetical protein K5777_05160 [Nitrosopumilus sp.]|nr:hypothetical protein [Nitrosopumilus sp.]
MKSKNVKYHIQTHIKASKIPKKLSKSAYGYSMAEGIFAGLPASKMKGKWVQLTIPPLPPRAVVPIGHIGPWNGGGWNDKYDDPYWRTKKRPQAETGKDFQNKTTDKSGIQISDKLWKLMGLQKERSIFVNWHFVQSPKNKRALIIDENGKRKMHIP